jgi:DNA-directed RNA polymerase subunit RPC12/RpoP
MPIIFTCACGRQIRARDEDAGKTANCPACSASIVVPGVPAIAVTTAGPSSSAGQVAATSPSGSSPHFDGFRVVQTMVLSLLLLVFGLGAWSSLTQSRYLHDRFQNDNAYGATANALADIRYALPRDASGWFIAALLCWLIMAVNRLRWTIQDRK